MIGDQRPYLVALVTLDPDNVKAYATGRGITFTSFSELQTAAEVRQLVDAEGAVRAAEFASFERVKKVAIVDEFTIGNDLLTPTLKLKRGPIQERHVAVIEALYAE